ncbi:flagellin [Arthrobacter sp. 2YAF22_2]|uniref:flagellin N-terminal helical domain-containing protein n=1 Tax=Arthrobacter sp. 2YAF22_2 TaxID=3233029 RepID=UPI003F93596A
MGMVVNTNIAAANAYRNLSSTQTNLNKSLEKLSSGLRINRAADDAAGLAISEGLRSQVNGLGVAANNAQDGINVVQTAEGGLNQTHAILQRLRDLAVQAGNDSNNADSRKAIATEATGLVDELGRIGDGTNFNGISLLNGKAGASANGQLSFQIGAGGDASSQITVDLSKANVRGIADSLKSSNPVGGQEFDFQAFDGGTGAPTIAGGTYTFTSTNGTATSTVSVDTGSTAMTADELVTKLNSEAGFAGKFNASIAKNTDGSTKGIIVTSKDGGTVGTTAPSATDLNDAPLTPPATPTVTGLDFSSATGAKNAINLLDEKIKDVSTARAALGASQNRLESAVQTIGVAKENLTASESRIRDVDMADEMSKYTRSNILSQAGTAMLAQANQSTQGVLSLLR